MLRFDDIWKSYETPRSGEDAVAALEEFTLDIGEGEFVAMLGPSGAGKSTALRCAAGLETPSKGKIFVGDACVFDAATGRSVASSRRGIGVVFQSYAIWPHMTVAENVAFPLKTDETWRRRWGRWNKDERIRRRVGEVLEVVGLGALADRPAVALSGGEQQRVAFARAIVSAPQVLLLDEPLSNLDLKLREQLRVEVLRLQREVGVTTVYVTHDQTDALSLAERVVVLRDGKVRQIGPPEDVYERPADRFVADFVGSGNFLPGEVVTSDAGNGLTAVRTGVGIVLASWEGAGVKKQAGAAVVVFVRPEHLQAVARENPAQEVAASGNHARRENTCQGVVTDVMYFGDSVDYIVDVNGTALRARGAPTRRLAMGCRAALEWPASATGLLQHQDAVEHLSANGGAGRSTEMDANGMDQAVSRLAP